jgi:hypothetical protein
MATMVTRTQHNITLYILVLPNSLLFLSDKGKVLSTVTDAIITIIIIIIIMFIIIMFIITKCLRVKENCFYHSIQIV